MKILPGGKRHICICLNPFLKSLHLVQYHSSPEPIILQYYTIHFHQLMAQESQNWNFT